MMKWVLGFFSILLFYSCQNRKSPNTDIKFAVQEYKIRNDSVTNFNSRFARLIKDNDNYIWTKLFRLDTYSSLGFVDSFYIADSIRINYSLNEDQEISRINNWPELKQWAQEAIDIVMAPYDKPFNDKANKLLEMGMDSATFITKNIMEVNAYHYYYLIQNESTASLFEKTSDEYFCHYNLDLVLEEKDLTQAVDLVEEIVSKDFELTTGSFKAEIITNKLNGEFIMGIINKEMISGTDTGTNRIVVSRIDEFSLVEINKFEN